MNAVELVELAGLVAREGQIVIQGSSRPSSAALRAYWSASKARLDRWGIALRRYERQLDEVRRRPTPAHWLQTRSAMVEVLGGEVLARVWAALMVAHDRHHGLEESEPIARSVFVGHLEARRRVLGLMASRAAIPRRESSTLNQFRRRCERWNDLFVGYLMAHHDVGQFAFKPRRARDLAESVTRHQRAGASEVAWTLTLQSLRAAFHHRYWAVSPNGDLNGQIAASILACFPPERFECVAVQRTLWLHRLQSATEDAESLVDELLSLEGMPR